MTTRGLDVSSYQGTPDFSKLPVADQIRFVIVKCAEGMRGLDAHFAANRDGARAAGLAVGCYNFAHPEEGDPRGQAQRHFQVSGGLGKDPGELPPTLDFESPDPTKWQDHGLTPDSLCEWGLDYLDEATSLWACKPVIYTYPDFWMHLGGGHRASFSAYYLWIAHYAHPGGWPADDAAPMHIDPWGATWSLWQTSGGQFYKLPGGASCDTNLFNGDAAALAAFCATDRV